MSTPAYLLSSDTLTIFVDGMPATVHKSHPQWQTILDLIRVGDWARALEKARPRVAVTKYLNGNPDFVIHEDDGITFRGAPCKPLETQRLLDLMHNDMDTGALTNFIVRKSNNPSQWIDEQLYPFIEKGGLPLTPDGCFLAYKKIRADYTDVFSGTVKNTVGSIVEMPRNKVDDNRDRTCSSGLHACSLSYLTGFGGERVVAVKIDPADVVSVPSDYNDSKLRCCRYEVVAELDPELAAPAWTTPVFDYPPMTDDGEEELKWYVRRGNSDYYEYWDREDKAWSAVAWEPDCVYGTPQAADFDREALQALGVACEVVDNQDPNF